MYLLQGFVCLPQCLLFPTVVFPCFAWPQRRKKRRNEHTLLHQDLALYKKFREKEVASAARSLISLFRELAPGMLEKRDRGRDADLGAVPLAFGARTPASRVEGADLLQAALQRGEEGDSELEVSEDEALEEEPGNGGSDSEAEVAGSEAEGEGEEEEGEDSQHL